MDHAEAHERIADLALEPQRLLDLEIEPTPEELALLTHAQTCPACQADLDAWRRTHGVVAGSGSPDGLAIIAPSDARSDAGPTPPDSLRAAIAAIPGRSPRLLDSSVGATRSAMEPRRRRSWPAAAAVLLVGLAIGLSSLVVDQARQADSARRQAAELAALSATVDRVLQDAGHTSIGLFGADGKPLGTAAWSAAEIVVMSTAIEPPQPGAEYRCWVERDGRRTPIGVMRFTDGVAYWSGSLDRYADVPLDGGGQLGVSLEVAGQPGEGAPIMIGELPS